MKMTLKAEKWNSKSVEAMIIPAFEKEEVKGLPKFADQILKDAIDSKEFEGKLGQVFMMMHPSSNGAVLRKIYILGLGKESDLTIKQLGQNLGKAVRQAQSQKVSNLGFALNKNLLASLNDDENVFEAIAEYAEMASYEFSDHLKTKKPQLKSFTIFLQDASKEKQAKQSVKAGKIIAEMVNESRSAANQPSNTATPTYMAELLKEAAKKESNLNVTVLSEAQMEKKGMGGVLGVSKGSEEEAKFVIVEYLGAEDKKESPYVIVGKGVTFDTGGISLKPGQSMDEMKFDMCGATAAMGTIRAAAALGVKLNIVALMPFSENMPSGRATKPGDVLVAMDGSTIEVMNTDAEGRLLLADALVYAKEFKPKMVIDLATLTGACVVALYDSAAGMYTKNDDMASDLSESAKHTGDMVWRMPLPDEYKDLLKSKVADISNLASVPYGGSITAAVFLQHFVNGKYPWAHLDIAGVAWAKSGKKYLAPGATGAGIRTLVHFLRSKQA